MPLTRLGGFGFLDKRHCEKTSFITFGAFVVVIVLSIMFVQANIPETDVFGLFDEPISYLAIAVAFTVGGYLGVLYYRYANKKRPLFILKFWSAEA